jgi:hypothetical protein
MIICVFSRCAACLDCDFSPAVLGIFYRHHDLRIMYCLCLRCAEALGDPLTRRSVAESAEGYLQPPGVPS